MIVTVTRDDLEQQPAFSTVYTVTGLDKDGRRVRFGGDWRAMDALFGMVMQEGAIAADVEPWQVLSREDPDPPEYQPTEDPDDATEDLLGG